MKQQALPLPASSHQRRALDPQRWVRAIRIVHPFPTLLNVAATAGLAFVAAHGAPDASLLVRMLVVMLCAQSAIGVVNDVFDRDLDAVAKPWKPLVSGAVALPWAIAFGAALIAITSTVAATLGAAGFALAMLGMTCGLAYDVRLKRTALSALPYMVAIPTLPLWVWATLGAWEPSLWWLLPLGALIGVALHLANTLPDLEDDARFGLRGLAHRLGEQRSMLLGASSFALALAISAAIAPVVTYDLRIYVPAALFGLACLAVSVASGVLRRDEPLFPLGFAALAIGSATLAVGWLAAVTA